MKDIAESKDLFLSALWLATGHKLLGIRRVGPQCWFQFVNKKECEELKFQLYSKEALVNAKDFIEAIRSLKDLIYQN